LFYARLDQILDEADFDGYVEELCRPGFVPSQHIAVSRPETEPGATKT
jgi:hypothetical protein